jgi:hypothetical protein
MSTHQPPKFASVRDAHLNYIRVMGNAKLSVLHRITCAAKTFPVEWWVFFPISNFHLPVNFSLARHSANAAVAISCEPESRAACRQKALPLVCSRWIDNSICSLALSRWQVWKILSYNISGPASLALVTRKREGCDLGQFSLYGGLLTPRPYKCHTLFAEAKI